DLQHRCLQRGRNSLAASDMAFLLDGLPPARDHQAGLLPARRARRMRKLTPSTNPTTTARTAQRPPPKIARKSAGLGGLANSASPTTGHCSWLLSISMR